MKFIIGSASERKINIAKEVIGELFPGQTIVVQGYAAVSGVPETPYDRQTYDGAFNRARACRDFDGSADFYIGLESGLIERYGHMYEEAWAAVIDKQGKEYFGYSSGLKVPDYILKRMDELKLEHCHVMDIIDEEISHGVTDGLANDTWATYSGGAIARTVSLKEALRNSLIQIIASEDSLYVKN